MIDLMMTLDGKDRTDGKWIIKKKRNDVITQVNIIRGTEINGCLSDAKKKKQKKKNNNKQTKKKHYSYSKLTEVKNREEVCYVALFPTSKYLYLPLKEIDLDRIY